MSERKGKPVVSTEPYKGVRDFYPEDQMIQRYILDTMAYGAELFGYQEYNASPLEPAELYESKSSEEIVNEQTYTFEDRGNRRVTLRPEMTPTVARMIAARRKSLSFPVRLYSIPNVFRYERPQRGRLREHYQLNVDLFGVSSIDAEIEIIALAHTLLTSFGLSDEQFKIRINDRRAFNRAFKERNFSDEKIAEVLRLLDKKGKIQDFDARLEELIGEPYDFDSIESDEVNTLIAKLNELGINNIVYDRTLARGFDYYTGIVFEIFDTNPENSRSLFGGGRYDNLLEVFGVEPVPTVGFGMGDVTIRDVLESYGLLPEGLSSTDVYMCVLDAEYKTYAERLALKLRGASVRVTGDLRYDNLKEQLKRAAKMGARWALVIGSDEVATNKIPLKNLETGEQVTLDLEDIVEKLRN